MVVAAIPRALAGSSPAFHHTTSYAAPGGSGPTGCQTNVTFPLRVSAGRGSSRIGAPRLIGVGDGLDGCAVVVPTTGLPAPRMIVSAGVTDAVGADVGDGAWVREAVGAGESALVWEAVGVGDNARLREAVGAGESVLVWKAVGVGDNALVWEAAGVGESTLVWAAAGVGESTLVWEAVGAAVNAGDGVLVGIGTAAGISEAFEETLPA